MNDFSDSTTVAIKPCNTCGVGMLESEKYCRRCGAFQQANRVPSTTLLNRVETQGPGVERKSTCTVNGSASERFGRTVSGPLVDAIVAGVTTSSHVHNLSRRIKTLVVALVAVPIWLIVVLLSPVDAYVALKEASIELHR